MPQAAADLEVGDPFRLARAAARAPLLREYDDLAAEPTVELDDVGLDVGLERQVDRLRGAAGHAFGSIRSFRSTFFAQSGQKICCCALPVPRTIRQPRSSSTSANAMRSRPL